jgi:hypothetical protein
MAKTDLGLSGEGYAPVADRVRLFYERYPTGRILTHLVRRTDDEVVFRAEVFRGPSEREPAATGWAAEREGDGDINTVACLENTETSAVGRALANLGFVASKHRPSREEMEKADRARVRWRVVAEQQPRRTTDARMQRRADRATEVLTLLQRASHLGFSSGKATVLRERVTRRDADAVGVSMTQQAIEKWLVVFLRPSLTIAVTATDPGNGFVVDETRYAQAYQGAIVATFDRLVDVNGHVVGIQIWPVAAHTEGLLHGLPARPYLRVGREGPYFEVYFEGAITDSAESSGEQSVVGQIYRADSGELAIAAGLEALLASGEDFTAIRGARAHWVQLAP